MMRSTNASPVLFGFDFQVNAAIFLMLDNLSDLKKMRLEGKSEDIELLLSNGHRILAQAKSIVNPYNDFSNVREKLKAAISSLSNADEINVDKLIMITNSPNPLKDLQSSSLFYGPTFLGYSDLPDESKIIIDKIISSLGCKIDLKKFNIQYLPFSSDDRNERYKILSQLTSDFLSRLRLGDQISNTELLEIWQNEVFFNGSTKDLSIELSKNDIVWPVIVLTIENSFLQEYLDEYDQGTIDEILNNYNYIINNSTERYEIVTQIVYDYSSFEPELSLKEKTKAFISLKWKEYIDILCLQSLEPEVAEGLAKLILSKVLQQRYSIDRIKKGVRL